MNVSFNVQYVIPPFSFKDILNSFILISRFFRKHLCQLGSLVHQQKQQQQQLNPREGGNQQSYYMGGLHPQVHF